MYIVTWGLTAGIAEPEKQPLLGNCYVNMQQYQSHRWTTSQLAKWRNCWKRCFLRGQCRKLYRKAIWTSPVSLQSAGSQSMRLAWAGHQPARTWARKKRIVRRWKQRDWEHWSVFVAVSCDIDASQRGRKPLNTEAGTRCQAAPSEGIEYFVRAVVICYVCRSIHLL
jgi:hypothetical protein